MSDFNIIKKTIVENTFRNACICGKFDIPISDESVFKIDIHLPIPENYGIGLIYGPSGSGKTLICKHLFGNTIDFELWDNSKSIVDNFPDTATMDQITDALTAVGFNSTPKWLLPYNCLSNGQQFRAQLAKKLCMSEFIVFDEFTSVVDRIVAKSVCVSLKKYRSYKKEIYCNLLSFGHNRVVTTRLDI